jgi:hypothetical protein
LHPLTVSLWLESQKLQNYAILPEANSRTESRQKSCYYSHLYSFTLIFIFLQTQATSYSLFSSVTVHCKWERRKTIHTSLWLKKSIQKLKSENLWLWEGYAQKPQRNCTFMNLATASGLGNVVDFAEKRLFSPIGDVPFKDHKHVINLDRLWLCPLPPTNPRIFLPYFFAPLVNTTINSGFAAPPWPTTSRSQSNLLSLWHQQEVGPRQKQHNVYWLMTLFTGYSSLQVGLPNAYSA